MTQQMYAEPVSPWALNAAQLDALRRQIVEAEAVVASAGDWSSRVRAEQNLKALRRQLGAAEFEGRLDAQRRARAQQRAVPPPPPMYSPEQMRARIAARGGHIAVVNAEPPEPEFMEPVPYWTGVANATPPKWPPKWPTEFAGRAALVQDAVAELRRSGAA